MPPSGTHVDFARPAPTSVSMERRPAAPPAKMAPSPPVLAGSRERMPQRAPASARPRQRPAPPKLREDQQWPSPWLRREWNPEHPLDLNSPPRPSSPRTAVDGGDDMGEGRTARAFRPARRLDVNALVRSLWIPPKPVSPAPSAQVPAVPKVPATAASRPPLVRHRSAPPQSLKEQDDSRRHSPSKRPTHCDDTAKTSQRPIAPVHEGMDLPRRRRMPQTASCDEALSRELPRQRSLDREVMTEPLRRGVSRPREIGVGAQPSSRPKSPLAVEMRDRRPEPRTPPREAERYPRSHRSVTPLDTWMPPSADPRGRVHPSLLVESRRGPSDLLGLPSRPSPFLTPNPELFRREISTHDGVEF